MTATVSNALHPDFLFVATMRLTGPIIVIDGSITHQYVTSRHNWVAHRLRVRADILKRVHYRMVLDVVGFDLLSLLGTCELLHSTYDALQGLSCG